MSKSTVMRHLAAGGVRIYSIPVQVFPTLAGNIYVVISGDYVALVDTGSGLGDSDTDLRKGIESLRDDWGEQVSWADFKRVVVTHAHIDHYGGLGLVRSLTDAPIAVHELDRRVLVHYEERLVLASRALSAFLARVGVTDERHSELMAMYSSNKGLFRSVEVETILRDGDVLDGLMLVHHAPGHCPGQVCLQVGDVLLTADHVLPHTSLFLSPESITPSTGLDHYLQALRKIAALPGIRLGLGGHEEPIDDVYACIERIEALQRGRVERVHGECAEPRTIAELTSAIYPNVTGYDTLLALQKIGAYVEYLDERGELAIANLDEVAANDRVAARYRKV